MSETAVPVLRLTDQGAALIARAVAQEKLTITRLAMGDGQLANVGSIPGLTAQIHERVSVPITKTTRKDNKLTVSGEVTLASTVSPFRWREVSLHGRIGTEAEVLMGYLYNSENGEMVSPADGVERCIYVTLEIDPVANVEVVLVPRESIDWEQIANPPEAYPPANHTHTAGDVGAAPVNHTHSAGDVGAAPASHTHSASDVGASPTGHKHSTDDLNGGILPVKRGGTGKGTALTADDVGALPASGGTLTGDLRLKDSRNYGMALRFGDGDIVKISEPSDDVLELKANELWFKSSGSPDESSHPLPPEWGGTGKSEPLTADDVGAAPADHTHPLSAVKLSEAVINIAKSTTTGVVAYDMTNGTVNSNLLRQYDMLAIIVTGDLPRGSSGFTIDVGTSTKNNSPDFSADNSSYWFHITKLCYRYDYSHWMVPVLQPDVYNLAKPMVISIDPSRMAIVPSAINGTLKVTAKLYGIKFV